MSITTNLATGMVVQLKCAVCGSGSGRVELVPPGQLPTAWAGWAVDTREVFEEYHDAAKWRLLFEGIEAGNGLRSDLTQVETECIANAFEQPLRVTAADKLHNTRCTVDDLRIEGKWPKSNACVHQHLWYYASVSAVVSLRLPESRTAAVLNRTVDELCKAAGQPRPEPSPEARTCTCEDAAQ